MTEHEITERIKRAYPAFSFDEHGLILNMNRLIADLFEKGKPVNMDEVVKFFDLVNSFNTGDNELYDIVEIGFLELLTDTHERQRLGFKYLKLDLLERFNRLFDHKFLRLL